MKAIFAAALLVAVFAASTTDGALAQQESILTYHGSPDRSGRFIVPGLTYERARSISLDQQFHPRISGPVYAQPLYWRESPSDAGILLVATETNTVHAIDAGTGTEIWTRSLGKPVSRASLSCGNISPLGVTGTPVIDESTRAIHLNAAVETADGPRHRVFALSLKDGATLKGWPVDVADAVNRSNGDFVPRDQNQRAALTVLDGMVYVAFGGHFGDCGRYRGTVLGIAPTDPRNVRSWATRTRGAGIWAPAGASSDGRSLFVATGNGFGTTSFADGEAIIRLAPDLHRSNDPQDYFAPTDWQALDERDADLSGTHPVLLDVPSPTGTAPRVLALGKDRKAYLLDRNNLGGIGGSIATETVSTRAMIGAPATYVTGDAAFVAVQGPGAQCPDRGAGLTVLKIRAAAPLINTAWCGSVRGGGSPIVTTTDGSAEPIVWMLGAEGDNRLHAFRGDNGQPIYSGPAEAMTGLRHMQTLIATPDRLYVAGDHTIYAFGF
jgi:outer membrane protein assembly factor BamB